MEYVIDIKEDVDYYMYTSFECTYPPENTCSASLFKKNLSSLLIE